MTPIQVIFENGVLRPVEPVSLPEGARVEVLIITSIPTSDDKTLTEVLDRIAALPSESEANALISEEYERLVAILDELIDIVGEDEAHPLASLMEIIGVLIERYEDEHVPEFTD